MNQLFVRKLTVIDFSYLDPERGLLGESWLVDVILAGSLDHQGMVLDFSDVKKKVKRLIDEEFDHKLIVPAEYKRCTTTEHGKRLHNRFTTADGRFIEHIAPASAYCFLSADKVTTDHLSKAIIDRLTQYLPDNVNSVTLKLYPENIKGDYYHYSHGLKHHAGNCQRIAHGHRSRIEIFENGKRDTALEHEWAQKWRDIYIGTKSDINQQTNINGTDYINFRYTACQGQFELTLPASNCYLIDIDTTVENLAQHITNKLKEKYPDRELTVYTFEGIDKGAIGHTA